MYLSRLILDPRSRDVHRDLSNVQDMHRTIMSAFPDTGRYGEARSRLGVLYRLETARSGLITLLVQSHHAPDWSALPLRYLADLGGELENPAVKMVDGAYSYIHRGDCLVFRLRANPTRKIETKTGPDGRRRHGRRVELIGEEKQVQWLRRKGEQAGFAILSVSPKPHVPNVRSIPEDRLVGRRQARDSDGASTQESPLIMRTVLFEGVLQVTDEARFRQALEGGIGPGKAYGCGMLSVRPAREAE